jgi:hypothetical protein
MHSGVRNKCRKLARAKHSRISRGGRASTRRYLTAAALLSGCAQLAWAVIPGVASGGLLSARAARTLNVTDTAHLHRVSNSGEEILEVGRATGTLPGSVRAYINVGATVIVHFTIDTAAGAISGAGSGRLKGRAAEPSFAGRMTVGHGTGRYAHAHGEGGFYGTLDRKTYALVVQTTGTLSY